MLGQRGRLGQMASDLEVTGRPRTVRNYRQWDVKEQTSLFLRQRGTPWHFFGWMRRYRDHARCLRHRGSPHLQASGPVAPPRFKTWSYGAVLTHFPHRNSSPPGALPREKRSGASSRWWPCIDHSGKAARGAYSNAILVSLKHPLTVSRSLCCFSPWSTLL